MPKSLIEKRRAMSRSWNGNGQKYSPWHNWPVEMAIKTAMHYAIGRGWCVIDDTDAARALNADAEPPPIEMAGVSEAPLPTGRGSLRHNGITTPADAQAAGPAGVPPANHPA